MLVKGAPDGTTVGVRVGVNDGPIEGEVGLADGNIVGAVGAKDGDFDGAVGENEGDIDGAVGTTVGAEEALNVDGKKNNNRNVINILLVYLNIRI